MDVALRPFSGVVQFTSPNDILLASNYDQNISKQIENKTKQYYTIDVSEAMKQLATVGNCLQLAYAGSKGFKSCSKVVQILSSYQSMVKNSSLACQTFVSGSLMALKYHVVALKIADRDMEKAMQTLAKCEALAEKMEKASGELENDTEKLCKASVDALTSAVDDETVTIDKRKEVKQAIANMEARAAELREKTKLLVQQIEEERMSEEQARSKAESLGSSAATYATVSVFARVFTLGLIGFESTGHELSAQAAHEREKSDKAAGKRRELQDLQREDNAELAKSVKKLQSSSLEQKDLSAAINSLEVSVKALGKIKTVFENTRVFWMGVKQQCKALQENDIIKTYADLNMKNEAIDEIKSSGLNWLSLGKINLSAQTMIQEIDQKVDNIMSDLPTESQALELIQIVSASILKQIETS